MSDDLVKRLRGYGSNRYWPHGPACDCTQAAARIEELEDKLAKAEAMFDREIRRIKKLQSDFPKPHTVSLFSVQCEYELMLAELTGGKID